MPEKTEKTPKPEQAGKPDNATTFAVIATGGKQYKVAKGDVIDVERLTSGSGDTESHSFTPVLLVSRGEVRATPKELEGATVTAKAVEHLRGPKITGFTYKPKTNSRKRWGHRQGFTRIEITAISVGSAGGAKASERTKTADQPEETGE